MFGLFGKKARPGAPRLPVEEVRRRILAVNRDTAPFRIMDGKADGCDLVAEWKIIDAQWYEVFAKAGLKKVFRTFMKFDTANHAVRAKDHAYTLEWRAGLPILFASVESFWGQKVHVEFGAAFAFTEQLAPGQVYQYRFDTRELKTPVMDTVTDAGWDYKAVAFRRL